MGHEEQLKVCLEKWKAVDNHLAESVAIRDRLKDVELKLEILQKEVLKNAVIGGLIGALVGSGAAPAVTQLVSFLLKGN